MEIFPRYTKSFKIAEYHYEGSLLIFVDNDIIRCHFIIKKKSPMTDAEKEHAHCAGMFQTLILL